MPLANRADSDNQDVFADLRHVFERDRLEPLDADVNAVRVIATGNLEVLALRRTGANKDRVVAFVEQLFHAIDAVVQLEVDPHVEDVTDFLVEHVRRQAELRNIGPHQAARRIERLKNRHVITERSQVVSHG